MKFDIFLSVFLSYYVSVRKLNAQFCQSEEPTSHAMRKKMSLRFKIKVRTRSDMLRAPLRVRDDAVDGLRTIVVRYRVPIFAVCTVGDLRLMNELRRIRPESAMRMIAKVQDDEIKGWFELSRWLDEWSDHADRDTLEGDDESISSILSDEFDDH